MTTKEEPKMLTLKDLAKTHKLEPRRLRVILRASGMRAKDGRYEWAEKDPFIAKLPGIIKAYETDETTKKSAKKA